MIIGNIEHLDLLPYLPIKLKEAIEFIKNNVNQNTPLGRYDIDGNNLFFMISENELRNQNNAQPEFHQRYVDIQIVLNGVEGIAVSTHSQRIEITDNRIDSDDIAFVKTPEKEIMLKLHENDFVIFYPNEQHKPLCIVDENIKKVRKIVVKADVNFL